ncbi:MAG: AMP-binding protein, partial [Oscillospiraceae bacterium]|nr:AMP-binding protein [Oscillospiraceae bacterium]
YKRFELEYLLRQSDSMTLLFCDGARGLDYLSILNDLLPELKDSEPGAFASDKLPRLKNIIHLPREASPAPQEGLFTWGDINIIHLPGEASPAPQEGLFTWGDILALGAEVSDEELAAAQRSVHWEDISNMQYTSGTTGFPKGVMLTHFNIINNGLFIGDCMRLSPRDRMCIPVPFFHCFGMVLAQMACITHASTMVPVEIYSPVPVMETIQAERCTGVYGVPTMFIFILEHPDFEKYDLTSLRTGIMAGSTCPIEVMRQVIDKMNMRDIVITYGQTESSPGMTTSHTDDPVELRVSTVGQLLPHTEGKIVDPETGLEVPPGVQGEICTRGYLLMRGYYNMPEATAAVIDEEGWLHTGDLGSCDENGYYTITGRIKDMIIRGGENIYPREIEELLYTCPGVKDVQVVAVPSRKFGEEVCAFVIRREGASVDKEDILAFAAHNISRHKVPSYVLFIDELPMNAAGKILKYKLREQATRELGLEGDGR